MKKWKKLVLRELKKDKNSNLVEFICSPRKKILFGTGQQAGICHDMCKRLEVKIEAFMSSKKDVCWPVLPKEIAFFYQRNFLIQEKSMMCC